MKCMRCGAELGEGAQSCVACGTSTTTDAPPLSLFQGIAEANRKPKNKLLGMTLAVGAIACVAVALFYLVTGDKKQAGANNSSTAPEVAISKSNQSTASVSFPELHFASSGRLPTKLHIFRLGMSIAEAMAEGPDLENENSNGGPGSQPPASDPSAQLVRRSEGTGFFERASFSHGRLSYVSSTVSSISPADASLFNRNTLVRLGKPDIEIYAGPSANAWVWIDGDVRIRYDNSPGGNPARSRTVSLTMVVYPEFMKGLLAELSKPSGDPAHWDSEANLEFNKHEFGEDASKVVLKELPTGLSDLRLRMTPLQVCSTLQGIELIRMSESQQQGELKIQDVTTDVALWDGLVSFVGRTWEKVPPDQVLALRRHLMEEFGTPSARVPPVTNQFESITWEDDHTKITYMFSVIASDESHQVQAFYYDKQLQALSDASDSANHPSEFMSAPTVHSFF